MHGTPYKVIEAMLGILPIYESLKNLTILEIIRLKTLGQWDSQEVYGHYAVNKLKQIKTLSNKCDMSTKEKRMSKAKKLVITRHQWRQNPPQLNGYVKVFTDASIDRNGKRTGIGAHCDDPPIVICESSKKMMSSYKAELYAVRKALGTLEETGISGKLIACIIDNLAAINSITAQTINSRILKWIEREILLLEERGNELLFVWVPSHQDQAQIAINPIFQGNEIADQLTRDVARARKRSWNLPNTKSELKKLLYIESLRVQMYGLESNDQSSLLNILRIKDIIKLRYNMALRGVRDSRLMASERFPDTMTDMTHLTRTNAFKLLSFVSGTNLMNGHMSLFTNRQPKCRICKVRRTKESTKHLLFHCTALNDDRERIFGERRLDEGKVKFQPTKILKFINETGIGELLIDNQRTDVTN